MEQDVVEHGVVELGGVSKVSVGVEVEGCATGEHALAAGLASIFLTLVCPDLKKGQVLWGEWGSFSMAHYVLPSTFEL